MVTTDKYGFNTYTSIEKDGDTYQVSKKDFGKLVSQGVEVIKWKM